MASGGGIAGVRAPGPHGVGRARPRAACEGMRTGGPHSGNRREAAAYPLPRSVIPPLPDYPDYFARRAAEPGTREAGGPECGNIPHAGLVREAGCPPPACGRLPHGCDCGCWQQGSRRSWGAAGVRTRGRGREARGRATGVLLRSSSGGGRAPGPHAGPPECGRGVTRRKARPLGASRSVSAPAERPPALLECGSACRAA